MFLRVLGLWLLEGFEGKGVVVFQGCLAFRA